MSNDKINGDGDRPALLLIDQIYDALDEDRALDALRLARNALAENTEDDPVVRFLAGVALMELDRASEAVFELRRAAELDEEDAEARAALALACFRSCAFDEARSQAAEANRLEPDLADAHHVLGLVLERTGDRDEAEAEFVAAAELDSSRFRRPVRMTDSEFETHLAAAMDRLPENFRKHLADVAVTVEDLPSDAILTDETPPLDPELLGLFVGVTLEDRAAPVAGDLPPRVLVFKRNLERFALERDELEEEIAVTLYHELGHYLGLDEDELAEINLA